MELSTDKLAKNIFLEIPGVEGRFSDNYFDLMPGVKKSLEFYPISQTEQLNDLVKIKSLFNCYE